MDVFNSPDKEKGKINHIKKTEIFANLKSDYFLKKIFESIKQKKKLEITKYNKNLQQRLNLDINDYKEFSEIYSSIEIEIIPAVNKYGKFINFDYEEEDEEVEEEGERKYYHIYFNNNKEEIKRNKIMEKDNVKKIKITYSAP